MKKVFATAAICAGALAGCATTPVGTACANQVSRGMTYQEVVSILGQPDGGRTSDMGNGKQYQLTWRSTSMGMLSSRTSIAMITFKDDKVQSLICQ